MAMLSPERAWARASAWAHTPNRWRRPWAGRPRSRTSLSSRGAGAGRSPGVAVGALHTLPAQEDVARRLHQVLPGDDPLAVIGVLALAHELLEDRGFGLFGLQEQRVVAVATLEQEDPGPGPHTADPPRPCVPRRRVRSPRGGGGGRSAGCGGSCAPTRGAHSTIRSASLSVKSSAMGTTSGGSLMIRRRPSTTVVSLARAWSESLVRDFATIDVALAAIASSRLAFSLLVAVAARAERPAMIPSMSTLRVPHLEVARLGQAAHLLAVGRPDRPGGGGAVLLGEALVPARR